MRKGRLGLEVGVVALDRLAACRACLGPGDLPRVKSRFKCAPLDLSDISFVPLILQLSLFLGEPLLASFADALRSAWL